MQQTVNLSSEEFGGSSPPFPTDKVSGSSSFGRAIAFQAIGGGFEPRLPLEKATEDTDGGEKHSFRSFFLLNKCRCSSVVEHFLGKEGVTSSTLVNGSKFAD